jgi:chaperonin GroES
MQPRLFKTHIAEYQQATWTGTNESGWSPLNDKILVYPDQASEKTKGGIQLTADSIARHTLASEAGVCVEIGPDCTLKISPGDRIYIERYAGQLVTGHDGKVYRLMDQSSVGAVFKESNNG